MSNSNIKLIANKVHSSLKNLQNLLELRNFDAEPIKKLTVNDLKKLLLEGKCIFKMDHNDDDRIMLIYFLVESKIKVQSVNKIKKEIIEEYKIKKGFDIANLEVILILKDEPNPTNNKKSNLQIAVDKFYNSESCYIQLFGINSLKFNILEHALTPKHEIISEDEFEKLGVKRHQLPCILREDPVAKFIGMKPDDVCRIIRPSPATGITIIYRYCK